MFYSPSLDPWIRFSGRHRMTPPDELPASPSPADANSATRFPWEPALFVAVLAFLLASFPAVNSDLWRHLAAGRQLVQGGHPVSPAGAEAAPRAGSTWLYDLLTYALFTTAGGTGLVFGKALVAAGLALVLFHLSRAGSGWGLATACTALAVLAVATRLRLQPATLSYLLLALALWGAGWANGRPVPPPVNRHPLSGWLPPWPLLLLFVCWVNLDGWYVIGLAAVALAWLGRTLNEAGARPQQFLRRLAALAVLAAVCLLNPAHVHAFAVPPELAQPSISPFVSVFQAVAGMTPVRLAYFVLLGLGLWSFMLNLPQGSWQRFLPWVALAGLSAWHAPAVPFFAVAGGPALARNLQEYFARHPVPERGRGLSRKDLLALRPLGVILGALLLLSAWPGWLQSPPFGPRRWAVETAPSAEAAAVEARRWYQAGKFGPDARGLHLTAETADAFAWFCPEGPGVHDTVLADPFVGRAPPPADWLERMRAAGITYVVVSDPTQQRLFLALNQLLSNPDRWPLLFTAGDVAVFGFRDSARPGAAELFRGQELDVDRLAYRPAPDQRAPRVGPAYDPTPRYFWEAFWKPALRPLVDRAAATLYMLYAEAMNRRADYRHLPAWEACQVAGLITAAGGWADSAGAVDAFVRAELFRPVITPGPGARVTGLDRLALNRQRLFKLHRDDTPPALLFLAIRAARRALADQPDDAGSLMVLAEAYQRLLHQTRERVWGNRLRDLVELRRTQASWALNLAAELAPNSPEIQYKLGTFYRELGYLDLALRHLRIHQQLVRKAGPPPGFDLKVYREEDARYEADLSRLAAEVEDKESVYEAESQKLRIQDRARKALDKGLAGKALELLRESHVSAFGQEGLALELELMLRTGRAREVRDWTSPEQQEKVGEEFYHWTRIQALAAVGDYAQAEDELALLATGGDSKAAGGKRALLALAVGQAILNQQPGGESLWRMGWLARGRAELGGRLGALATSMRQEADWNTLRGLLALEEGEIAEASAAFRTSLAFWRDESAAASGSGLDFSGRVIAQEWLRQLDRPGIGP
jgi:hypothetical protein